MQRVNVSRRRRKHGWAIMLDYHDKKRRVQKVVGFGMNEDELAVIEEAARREAARLNLELIEGTYQPRRGETPIAAILAEFLEHVESSTRRESTKKLYRWQVARFHEFLATTTAKRAKDLTPALMVSFVLWQKDSAPDTVRSAFVTLSKCLSRAMERGDIQLNPCKHPDVRAIMPQTRKHERFFDDEEFEQLLDAAAAYHHEHMADFLLLLGESGLRVTEAFMLRWCDTRFDDGGSFLRVTPHDGWEPKTKTSIRRVPLSQRVADMLRRRLRDAGTLNPTARVFPESFDYGQAAYHFGCILAACGLNGEDAERGQRLRLHSLRHTFASRLVRNGASAAEIRDLCGHGSITMTDRYLQVPNAALFGAVSRAFDPSHNRVTQSGRIEEFSGVNSRDEVNGTEGRLNR